MTDKPKVSKEAMDWANEALKEMETYKAANPDWKSKGKSLDQFRREARERLGLKKT